MGLAVRGCGATCAAHPSSQQSQPACARLPAVSPPSAAILFLSCRLPHLPHPAPPHRTLPHPTVPCPSSSLAQWERSKWVGVSMVGKTLAIMGFGKVGSEVARRARGEDQPGSQFCRVFQWCWC